jgi:cytochrome c-type biogenesis protein CcmE
MDTDAPDAAQAPRSHGRARVVVPLIVIVGAIGWVAVKGLAGNLVYYKTPTEVVRQGASVYGERIRLGGYVEPCSVHAAGHTLRFLMADPTTTVTVVTSSGVPQDFRGGAGAVAEGVYEHDGVFHADDILVKHDDSYSAPAGITVASACGG